MLIDREVAKGADGNPVIVTAAPVLRKDVYKRWAAGDGISISQTIETSHSNDLPNHQLKERIAPRQFPLDAMPVPFEGSRAAPIVEPATQSRTNPTQASVAPLFNEAAKTFLELRARGGASRGALSTAKLRIDVFLALVPDKPVDQYFPIEIRKYVLDLCFLPLQFGQQGKDTEEIRAMGPAAAVALNRRTSRWEPIGRKTIEDGYLQVIKAIFGQAVELNTIRHPFPKLRIEWPSTVKPSITRETLDVETLDRVFELGVASGYLDDAILPALAVTTSRRIGLLAFIRGSDFEFKHGVVICRVDGIGYDSKKGTWYRVPYKTGESLKYFVVHQMWTENKFIAWAMTQGETFIFRQLHLTTDPADTLSKRANRLLIKAGARGANVEVAHSLRHGAKDLMDDNSIDDKTSRQQMGHAPAADPHGKYGREFREILRKKCHELAHMPLIEGVDWSRFDGLDFEAMAARPRSIGRRQRQKT